MDVDYELRHWMINYKEAINLDFISDRTIFFNLISFQRTFRILILFEFKLKKPLLSCVWNLFRGFKSFLSRGLSAESKRLPSVAKIARCVKKSWKRSLQTHFKMQIRHIFTCLTCFWWSKMGSGGQKLGGTRRHQRPQAAICRRLPATFEGPATPFMWDTWLAVCGLVQWLYVIMCPIAWCPVSADVFVA